MYYIHVTCVVSTIYTQRLYSTCIIIIVIVENTTSPKLMGEYEKYQELQARSQRLQEDYERQLQNMKEAREKALHTHVLYMCTCRRVN